MTKLIQIGTSQGIRIPKVLIEKANLRDCEIEICLVDNGLLLKPCNPRAKWDSAELRDLAENDKNTTDEFSSIDIDSRDWEW